MMESVEDIPREAILSGLPWDWNSYGEYLDSIEKMQPAINMIGLVGHAAARFYVMGERSVDEQPTADEIQQIADLVGESVKDGAAGFSANRIEAHRLPDGRCMPGTFATDEEMIAISRAAGTHGGLELLSHQVHFCRQPVLSAVDYTLQHAAVGACCARDGNHFLVGGKRPGHAASVG